MREREVVQAELNTSSYPTFGGLRGFSLVYYSDFASNLAFKFCMYL